MRVLIACEFSGRVRDAFRDAGHEAWSCDLLGPHSYWDHPNKKAREFWREIWDSQRWPNYHLEGDALDWLDGHPAYGPWDLLIAHPDCTYMCNSGVQWLDKGHNAARMRKTRAAAFFFNELWRCKIPRKVIENPIMHKYARQWIDTDYTQTIQPNWFGDPETKRTCLWLERVDPLKPTNIVKVTKTSVHYTPPNPLRGLMRSVTFPGTAQAMAQQWGNYF